MNSLILFRVNSGTGTFLFLKQPQTFMANTNTIHILILLYIASENSLYCTQLKEIYSKHVHVLKLTEFIINIRKLI